MATASLIYGLPPILGAQPSLLILGSMPSVKSIAMQQYYAHPQNTFWRIMAQLLGFKLAESYRDNVAALTQNKVAVWDILAACERQGSLDSAIVSGTERLNPLNPLLMNNQSIITIGINGGAAYALFKRHHLSSLDVKRVKVVQLPSSSPAHAAMRLEQKQNAWRRLLELAR